MLGAELETCVVLTIVGAVDVGAELGDRLGDVVLRKIVGAVVGAPDGAELGTVLGATDGKALGAQVGAEVGVRVGVFGPGAGMGLPPQCGRSRYIREVQFPFLSSTRKETSRLGRVLIMTSKPPPPSLPSGRYAPMPPHAKSSHITPSQIAAGGMTGTICGRSLSTAAMRTDDDGRTGMLTWDGRWSTLRTAVKPTWNLAFLGQSATTFSGAKTATRTGVDQLVLSKYTVGVDHH